MLGQSKDIKFSWGSFLNYVRLGLIYLICIFYIFQNIVIRVECNIIIEMTY